MKYIFVTGGVVSGLGKGITAASLGRLLKARGKKVTLQKFDPYLNIDPGKMSPYQHGEVFVTDDGSSCDLDVGHYERFTDENMSVLSNITAGKIYNNVINKERSGEYGGKTVQVIPHITNEIKANVMAAGKMSCDVLITEIGGTVGDIESLPFLEACRQIQNEVGRENCIFVHVTLMPYIAGSNELKSKPTQHSVKDMLSLGIQPDILVCRTEIEIQAEVKHKLALFCNVEPSCVIPNMTSDTIYEVPLMLEREGLCDAVCRKLGFGAIQPDLTEWESMVARIKSAKRTIRVALVGKYVEMRDAYLSIAEALHHAAFANDAVAQIGWVQSADVTSENAAEIFADCDGIIVPSGFGERGIDGKIAAIGYARRNDIPFFGIGLGMQLAAVEFARNVLGKEGAHSTEFNQATPYPVVVLSADGVDSVNAPMQQGLYTSKVKDGTKVHAAYGTTEIAERHRHKYELNNNCLTQLEGGGMVLSAYSEDGETCEALELPELRHFVGVMFQPQLKSRPNKVHPLFDGFVKACVT
ncbi:MAG: CTP synthase [Oscillospiraceae bacterium]|nr:CTP synthase [Oscillospiraceae bacterium]